MDAAQHWAAAELDLERAESAEPEFGDYLVARAQVHATLAQAGATILAGQGENYPRAHAALVDEASRR